MANNYSPGTVYPELEKGVLSGFAREYLEGCGFTVTEYGGDQTVGQAREAAGRGCPVAALVCGAVKELDAGDGLCEVPGLPDAWGALHAIAKAHNIPEIVAEFAVYCDKMRMGEFGGYAVRVTPEGVQAGCTGDILRLMREGGWS
jgi:hypothetical protein